MEKYINRKMTGEFLLLLQEYPIVTILGPRQAGKTTFARNALPDYQYVNLELPENRDLASHDPKTFLASLKENVILDEIHRVPDLLSYIQVQVDDQQRNGQYVLTGSHQLDLSASITQSLAGRTSILHLLPLSIEELGNAGLSGQSFPEIAFTGFLPRIHSQQQRPDRAYANYLQTYVERDVRQLINIKSITLFEKFLKLVAGRVGQIINMTSLGNDVGVDQKTINSWFAILEASYILFKLPPYFNNFGKRTVKAPKYYFIDVGLLVYLLGIDDPSQISRDPLVGSIFENLVILELIKAQFNQGKAANAYFFRDSAGNEVDLLISKAGILVPIEIKSAATFTKEFLRGIERFNKLSNLHGLQYVVYTGNSRKLDSATELINYKDVASVVVELG
jgi:predicted AAA+ superfamily ATPase